VRGVNAAASSTVGALGYVGEKTFEGVAEGAQWVALAVGGSAIKCWYSSERAQ
jgi:hypothetical protein